MPKFGMMPLTAHAKLGLSAEILTSQLGGTCLAKPKPDFRKSAGVEGPNELSRDV